MRLHQRITFAVLAAILTLMLGGICIWMAGYEHRCPELAMNCSILACMAACVFGVVIGATSPNA